jgi:hypothetical protein
MQGTSFSISAVRGTWGNVNARSARSARKCELISLAGCLGQRTKYHASPCVRSTTYIQVGMNFLIKQLSGGLITSHATSQDFTTVRTPYSTASS